MCIASIWVSYQGKGAAQHVPQIEVPSIGIGNDGAYEDCQCVSSRGAQPQPYGMGSCKSWDADASSPKLQCRDLAHPDWCASKWCYVDSARCNRTYHENGVGTFSYTTCGNIGKQPNPRAHQIFVVGRMPFEDFFVGKTNQDPGLRFGYYVLKEMNMLSRIRFRNISDTSINAVPESIGTACVHDIALGNIDACLGSFWRTSARVAMGVAFIDVYRTDIYLFTAVKKPDSSLWTTLSKPLLPFTWGLWAVCVGAFVASTCVYVIVEGNVHDMFYGHESHEVFARALYETIVSFLSGGLAFEPETLSGRMLAVGLAFYIMIAVATFTGSTASALVLEAQSEIGVKDLNDALRRGHRVCYVTGAQEALFTEFPTLASYGVPSPNNQLAFDDLRAGKCDSALLVEHIVMQSQAKGKDCDYVSVGRAVLQYHAGYYVAEWIRPKLAAAVAILQDDGLTWKPIERSLIQPTSACPTQFEKQARGGYTKLGAKHMLGTVGVLLICSVTSLAFHSVSRLRSHARSAARTREAEPEEAEPEEARVQVKDEGMLNARHLQQITDELQSFRSQSNELKDAVEDLAYRFTSFEAHHGEPSARRTIRI